MEAAFIVFLTVFLFQHADPRGDGMEMVGVGFAFMLIFLPFTMPAFIRARHGRWLVLAAGLAALAAIAYVATSRFCSSGIASDARLPTREPLRDFEGQNGE
jgi:hypothetical protein